MSERVTISRTTLLWMADDALGWNESLLEAQIGPGVAIGLPPCESPEVLEDTRRRIRECRRIIGRLERPA